MARSSLTSLLLFVGASPVHGQPIFADLFQGGAVLQRSTEVNVWGTTAKADKVTLTIDGAHAADASVDASGKWTAKLTTPTAAFNKKLAVHGQGGVSTVTVSFGDVVLCSGQSNMDMPLDNKPGGFQADNGTAEVAASSRYTGGIWLWKQVESKYRNPTAWREASPTIAKDSFSAVCWYTGRNLFDSMDGKVPVGLFQASVGGSPIEYWLSAESLKKCETDVPKCDTQLPDSSFYDDQVVSLQPYTVGAIVWDQAERDFKCNHVEKYSCMQKELASSWREAFNSVSAPFVVLQMPDYYDKTDPGAGPKFPGYKSTAEGLLQMRLAQEAGLEGVEKSALVPTYDQSCNANEFPGSCPFGSVHNVHKQVVGQRVAAQLHRLMHDAKVAAEGPRADSITATVAKNGGFSVAVHFAGDASPFALQPTRNCTDCCNGKAKGDFSASHDGETYMLGSNATLQGTDTVIFHVPMASAPTVVRYTGGTNFTQCALFNKEAIPAMPFQKSVKSAKDTDDTSVMLV